MAGSFKLKQFAAGSCYSYVLSSEGKALVIDPHISLLEEYTKYLSRNKLALQYILDTHTHADHFSSAAVMKKKFKAPVLMHEKAVSEVADVRLKQGDDIGLGAGQLKVIYTPGHTDDAISVYGQGRVFTGDVLLIESVGRTDFQNGSPESMFDSLQKLKALPGETVVFPAHDYKGRKSSTIDKQKQDNPFLKEADKAAFVAAARSKALPKPFNIDNIIRVNQKGQAASFKMVSPKEAFSLLSKTPAPKLLDVRSAFEFSQKHIKDSVNIPIDMLAAKIKDLSRQSQEYIVFCRTGNRSPMAADMLLQSGIHSVKVMQGGITRWLKEKFPVIKGQGGISIERQVRAIAGSLILLGIVMAWFAHSAFLLLSVFISCGLIYAGLSDNCLMGSLLMNLPYNKKIYKAKLGGGTCSISQ